MNKFWIILFHTYFNKLKTKSFLITTLMMVIITLALTNLNNIIEVFDKDSGKEKVGVLDETGQFYKPFKEQMSSLNKNLQLTEFAGTEKEAEKAVEEGEIAGFVLLRYDDQQLPEAEYKAMSVADSAIPIFSPGFSK
jgi:ABC-2 type transport system permease protein